MLPYAQAEPENSEYLGVQLLHFLDLIAFSEGTSLSKITQHDGFDIIVSGVNGPNRFDDFSDHPFASGRPPILVVGPGERFPSGLRSTASGRYQIILSTWLAYKKQLGLKDFGPESQDLVARELIRARGALTCLDQQDIAGAIKRCSSIWASFPNNNYGQGGHSMAQLLAKWKEIVKP